MPTPDWTVLIDDIATQRLRTCTLCGGQVEQFAVDSWSNGTVLAAVVLCPPCQGVGKEQRKISVGRWSPLHTAPC
jgi:hypothetical protein